MAGEPDVVEYAQGIEQVEALEHQSDRSAPKPVAKGGGQAAEIVPGNADDPRARGRQAGQQVQQGALARTGRPDDETAFAGIDPPRLDVQNVPGAVAVSERLDLDHQPARHPGPRMQSACPAPMSVRPTATATMVRSGFR